MKMKSKREGRSLQKMFSLNASCLRNSIGIVGEKRKVVSVIAYITLAESAALSIKQAEMTILLLAIHTY